MQEFLKNSLLYSTIHSLLYQSNKSYHDILFVLTGLIVWSLAKHPSPSSTPPKCWQNSAKFKKMTVRLILDSFADLNTMGATSYTQLMNDVAF